MVALMSTTLAPPGVNLAPVTNDPPPVSAAIRVEAARQRKPGTELARAIGLSYSAWRKRLSGDVPWRATEVDAVARELGVPVSRLYEADR